LKTLKRIKIPLFKAALLLSILGCKTTPTNPPKPHIVDTFEKKIDPLIIASEVDSYYRSNELTKIRVDTTFAHSIHEAVQGGLKDREIPLSNYLRGLFKVSSRDKVSLKDRLCKYDTDSAQTLLKTSISSSGINLMNAFADEVNSFTKDTQYEEAYTRLMMCLAYSESLGDPDTSRSDTIASREGVIKNKGVKFYFDSLQTNPDSQINIGLYQFSPIASGNINPCLIDIGSYERSRKDLVNLLGSSNQVWNAKCGIHKILSLFYISKNSLDNRIKASNSCVTLHNRNAYNHFGPLQREANPGGGFTKLYQCYFNSKK